MATCIFNQEGFGSASHFNSVPNFCCAIKKFDEKNVQAAIQDFRDVFLGHGMEERYGLIMNHRHFVLQDGEILVETLNQNGKLSVAMPWKIENGLDNPIPTMADVWVKHGLQPKKHIIPQTWAFTEAGVMVPYEFLSSDVPDVLPPSSAFVADVFAVLQQHKLWDVLGLRRLDDDREGEAFEVTPKGERFSVTTLGSRPDGVEIEGGAVRKVLWYFTKDGDIRQAMDCYRCGSCGWCS